jgi:hypothetical protein
MRNAIAALFACFFLAGTGFTAADTATANDNPDATLELTGGAIAAGVGYVWGHGVLIYHGAKHKFSVSGLSIVDVGAASISASGVVYNLKNLDDLTGNYVAASAGLTIAGGGDVVILRNQHGVLIRMLATSQGLRFNLAGNGVGLKLEN